MKCTNCNKVFAARAALQQHALAAHGTSSNGNGNGQAKRKMNGNGNGGSPAKRLNSSRIQSTASGLATSGAIGRALNNSVTSLSGMDFLGDVSVLGTLATTADRIRRSFDISPSAFPGTRLTQLAPLWERYRFTRFNIVYVPAVAKTLACQMVVYNDTDPLDDPSIIPDANALIRQATAQTGSAQWNFHTKAVIPLAMRADRQWYYVGSNKQNDRFSLQGKMHMIQVTPALDFNGSPVTGTLTSGTIYIDWACDFQTPQIEPAAANKTLNPSPVTAVDAVLVNSSTTQFTTITVTGGDAYCSVRESDRTNLVTTADMLLNGTIFYSEHNSTLGGATTEFSGAILSPGVYTITYNNNFEHLRLTLLKPFGTEITLTP